MSANRVRVLFVLAFMAFAMPAAAQNGTITGRVTDEGGRGVAGAVVQAISGLRTVASASADENGNYRLSNVAPGTYRVQARRIGYVLQSVDNVAVGAGATATADLRLTEAPTQLETVVTGASKAPEKVLDAPASVSVVSAAQVNERPSINVADHVAALPGIDVARGGLMRANIVARGFNNIFSGALMTLTDNRFAFVPSLRVNIPYLSTTTNEDIERIEVARGPNSLLFGIGGPGGIVNTTPKRADPNRNFGEVMMRAGSWSRRRTALDVNRALLNGKLGARVNLMLQRADGYHDFESDDQERGALTFTWRPTDSTTIRAGGELGHMHQNRVRPWAAHRLPRV